MASISQKPNGTYLVRISCGKDDFGRPINRSKVFKPSKPNLSFQKLNKELNEFIRAFESEVLSGEYSTKKASLTVAKFSEEYLDVKRTSLSPNTMVFYEKVIDEYIIPLFGKMKLNELKTYHVQKFIQFLATDKGRYDGKEGHISASTVKRYTTVLRSMLTMAYKLEYMDDDIGLSRRLEFPKESDVEVEVYTFEEVKTILESLKEEPINIKFIIELALYTGLRRGEIVGLKWSDIDIEKKTLSVKRSIYKPHGEKAREKAPKSKSSIRTIGIPNCLIPTLLEYKANQEIHASYMGDKWNSLGYVFTEIDGQVMNPHTPTKQFSKFLKRHNIRHLKFHGLRHTSATLLLASGCDIKTVSTRLGHSDIDTTNIYVHCLESVDMMAANTFDRLHTNNTI